jgi:hypothetical protein
MRRCLAIMFVVAFCLASSACMDPRRAPPKPEAGRLPPQPAGANTIVIPAQLKDPLERNKAAEGIKKPAFYQVKGTDKAGDECEGYLVVEQAPGAYMTFGHFEWQCRRGGGRYHFKGTYDTDTRKAEWTGFTVKDKVGTPANSVYRVTVSADAKKLEAGTWQGGIAVPGQWTGDFLHGGD